MTKAFASRNSSPLLATTVLPIKPQSIRRSNIKNSFTKRTIVDIINEDQPLVKKRKVEITLKISLMDLTVVYNMDPFNIGAGHFFALMKNS